MANNEVSLADGLYRTICDAYILGLKDAKKIAERNEKFTDIKVSELIERVIIIMEKERKK